MPGDVAPGSVRVCDWPEPWLVLFGDGELHPVHIRSRSTSRSGRKVIAIEWHADGGTWQESYVVDAARMREPD